MSAEPKVPLIKWTSWLHSIGASPSTGWKWRRAGRISPSVNVDGKLYLTAADIDAFMQRAKSGEFAKETISPRNRKKQK